MGGTLSSQIQWITTSKEESLGKALWLPAEKELARENNSSKKLGRKTILGVCRDCLKGLPVGPTLGSTLISLGDPVLDHHLDGKSTYGSDSRDQKAKGERDT